MINNILGKNIYLREVQYSDSKKIVKWRNDNNIGKYLTRKKLTLTKQKLFIEEYFKRENDFYFIAELKNKKVPIGTVAVFNYDKITKIAEWGRIIVLPEYSLAAFEIAFLSIQFAFEELKINKIYGAVQKENKVAHRFDLSLGFVEEGILRSHYWNGKKCDDLILIAMFKDEYKKLKYKYKKIIIK